MATYLYTVKQFKVRIALHRARGRSHIKGKKLTCHENSTILDHSLNFGHPIVENDLKNLDCCDYFDIRTLESLYIHKLKPSLNDQYSSMDLFIVL